MNEQKSGNERGKKAECGIRKMKLKTDDMRHFGNTRLKKSTENPNTQQIK